MRKSRVPLIVLLGFGGTLSTALYSLHFRADAHRTLAVDGAVEPVTVVAGSRLGGSVLEVYARPGELVHKGQLLVRFDTSTLQGQRTEVVQALNATQAAIQGREVLGRIPDRLKRYIYETHPDIARAERQYIQALNAFESLPADTRGEAKFQLAAAAEKRTSARRELDRVLSSSAAGDELPSLLRNLRQNLAQTEELLRDSESRAPSDGLIDILDVKPGDRLLPGLPVAVLLIPHEYTSDLIVSEIEARRVHAGLELSGSVADAPPLTAHVESISKRRIPVPFRENRETSEETIVRVRMTSLQPIAPGAVATFQLP